MLKVLLVITLISKMNCLKNVCDKDCISDVMLQTRKLSKDSDHNMTIFFDQLLNQSEINQLIEDNTTDFLNLPHNFVPEISNYERGQSRKILSINW